jgi:DDE superfamily endonuclease
LPSDAPIVIGLDDTIERRWGSKIKARGIYRDPVRSSKGHFVKASGLRWLSAMLLVRVPWADNIKALPFLTLLAPSKRFYEGKPRKQKTLLDWARQAALQIRRWLPNRYIVLVADSAFAAIEFLAAIGKQVCVVTRLRLDANLFEFPSQQRKGRGRRPIKGKPHKKLSACQKAAHSWPSRIQPANYSTRSNRYDPIVFLSEKYRLSRESVKGHRKNGRGCQLTVWLKSNHRRSCDHGGRRSIGAML